jgi:hypothetical protein
MWMKRLKRSGEYTKADAADAVVKTHKQSWTNWFVAHRGAGPFSTEDEEERVLLENLQEAKLDLEKQNA